MGFCLFLVVEGTCKTENGINKTSMATFMSTEALVSLSSQFYPITRVAIIHSTMSLSKVLSLTLVVAVARASPVLNNLSRVLRRDLPAPSTYPLGDACGHEW